MKGDEYLDNNSVISNTQSNSNSEENSINDKVDEDTFIKFTEHKNSFLSLQQENEYLQDVYNEYRYNHLFNNRSEGSASQIMDELEKDLEKPKKIHIKKTESEIKQKSVFKKEEKEELIKPKIEKISGKKRKKKSGIKPQKGKNNRKKYTHDKSYRDNIKRKIKVHIIQNKIRNLINDYLKEKKIKKRLIKISKTDADNVTKDVIDILMKSTLKEIYKGYKIGKKTKTKDPEYNKKLINDIYERDDLKLLQNLLDLTFLEFYLIYTAEVTHKELSEDLYKKKASIEELFKVQNKTKKALDGKGSSMSVESNFEGIEVYIKTLEERVRSKLESEDEIKKYINKIKDVIENYEK